MIKPEMVPDEVYGLICYRLDCRPSDARGLVAAALNAWPGAKTRLANSVNVEPREHHLILPLMEKRDDE